MREALQNSLDARIDTSTHVCVDFRSYSTECNVQRSLLNDVISYREKCDLPIPDEWHQNKISWLVVQDYRATGLSGDLNSRTSDFWNYWLNFGQSNKKGSGRGGRGIGRVTFLISSKIQTVIGYTRRIEDLQSPICGMAVLRSIEEQDRFRSTHSYLASAERNSIYQLHKSPSFYDAVIEGFRFSDYKTLSDTGLALAIPYPHKELNRESILAAAIENFAPTIIDGTLQLNVYGTQLDQNSITDIAIKVKNSIRDPSINSDPQRYLDLMTKALTQSKPNYRLKVPTSENSLDHLQHSESITTIAEDIRNNDSSVIDLSLPLVRRGTTHETTLRCIAAETPEGTRSLDRFFRGGMCLPKVRSQDPGDFDLLFFVDDDLLGRYLNLCEGKAHLELSESKEISQKLRRQKFDTPIYRIKRLVKSLPRKFRELLYGDISQPDARVFEKFFSVSTPQPHSKRPSTGQPPFPDKIPKARIKPFRISRYRKGRGVRVVAATSFNDWPVELYAELGYADGRRRPKWNQADFQLEDLEVDDSGCQDLSVCANVVKAHRCNKDFDLRITGFDSKRELIVSWRTDLDANGS